jgi:two-component system LytT family response regulator
VIRAVIADDELLARRTLRELLSQVADVAIVAECRDGLEAVTAIRALVPDVVFLDIQMPGLDGFGALAEAGVSPVVVFVTAHEQHAVRAFDLDAVDYLLKPFDDERFARTLRRAREHLARRQIAALASRLDGSAPPPPPAAPQAAGNRLVVRDGRSVELVDPNAIDWIAAEGYYCELHLADRSLLVREPLQDLEATLDPARFVRIHRSTIVNVSRVQRVVRLPYGELDVILVDGRSLRASRARAKVLSEKLAAPARRPRPNPRRV